MRVEDLDNAVWQAVSKAMSNPKILITHLLCLTDQLEDENSLKEEKEKLLQERNGVRRKKRKIG